MSKQSIALGTAPTGAGGDDSRSAMVKINANFDEIYAAFGGNTLPASSAAAVPVVGTVATGAIIENGSNANGSYIRFADGTQIVMLNPFVTASIGIGIAGGNLVTFPVPFVNTSYVVSATCVPVTNWDHYGCTGVVRTSASQCNIYIRNGATSAQAFHIGYMAIGRWK